MFNAVYAIKNTCICLILFLGISILNSCSTCSSVDCDPANMTVARMRFVNSSGSNLLFGANKTYQVSDVKLYYLRGTDTVNMHFQSIEWGTGDTVLSTEIKPDGPRVFIRLSSSDTDTLDVKFKTYESKCCGTVHEFTKFKFNEKYEVLPSYEPLSLLK